MFFGEIGFVAVLADPFLDFLPEGDEVGEEDRIDGKKLLIGLYDVDGIVEEKDNVLYLHEETMGVGLAAFRGGVERAAQGKVEQ